MAIDNLEIIDTEGEQMEQQFWLTMMNHATNERQPEKQFCLVTKNLIANLASNKLLQEKQSELEAELAATQERVSEIQEKLASMSSCQEITGDNEEFAVTQRKSGEEISEVIQRDGQAFKVIYSKGQKGKNRDFTANIQVQIKLKGV